MVWQAAGADATAQLEGYFSSQPQSGRLAETARYARYASRRSTSGGHRLAADLRECGTAADGTGRTETAPAPPVEQPESQSRPFERRQPAGRAVCPNRVPPADSAGRPPTGDTLRRHRTERPSVRPAAPTGHMTTTTHTYTFTAARYRVTPREWNHSQPTPGAHKIVKNHQILDTSFWWCPY